MQSFIADTQCTYTCSYQCHCLGNKLLPPNFNPVSLGVHVFLAHFWITRRRFWRCYQEVLNWWPPSQLKCQHFIPTWNR